MTIDGAPARPRRYARGFEVDIVLGARARVVRARRGRVQRLQRRRTGGRRPQWSEYLPQERHDRSMRVLGRLAHHRLRVDEGGELRCGPFRRAGLRPLLRRRSRLVVLRDRPSLRIDQPRLGELRVRSVLRARDRVEVVVHRHHLLCVRRRVSVRERRRLTLHEHPVRRLLRRRLQDRHEGLVVHDVGRQAALRGRHEGSAELCGPEVGWPRERGRRWKQQRIGRVYGVPREQRLRELRVLRPVLLLVSLALGVPVTRRPSDVRFGWR